MAFVKHFFFALSACTSGAGGLFGGSSNLNPAAAGTPDTGTTNLEPEGESLPLSFLNGVDSAFTMTYNDTSSATVPVILYAGAVDGDYTNSNYQVIASTDPIEPVSALNSPRPDAGRGQAHHRWARERGFASWLISSAYADTTFTQCSNPNTTCCPIAADGSAQCYLALTNSSVAQVYVAVIDATGNVSPSNTETIHANALWLASAASDVTISNGSITAVTNDIAITAKLNDTNWSVQGDHTNNYLSWANDSADGETSFGSQFDFNPSTNTVCNGFGVLNSTDGIHFHRLSTDSTVTYEETVNRPSDATEFTAIKYTANNNLMYAVQKNSTEASIYHVFESDGESDNGLASCDPTPSSGETSDIKFLQSSDGITHSKTIAFDTVTLNTDGNDKDYALALFTNSSGKYFLRMGTYYLYTTTTFGTPLGNTLDFSGLTDLMIYYDQTDATNVGKAALLDSTNNKIWIVNYDVTKNRVNFNTNHFVSVGIHPSAMVLNDDKSKMYVMNYDDGTVSVLSLLDGTTARTTPTVTATFDLKATYFPDKNVTLHPNKIKYYNDQLIISCEGLKGMLIVNTSDIVEN